MPDPKPLRIGVQFQTHHVDPPRFEESVEAVLRMGVDTVFLWDHLVPFTVGEGGFAWDSWSLLGSFAHLTRETEQVLGILVSPLTFREPALLARMAATVALLGNHRFILGVGSGGYTWDDRLLGNEVSLTERMNNFSSKLPVLRNAIDEVNMRFNIEISMWVGGNGRHKTIPMARTYADGWNGLGSIDDFARNMKVLSGSTIEASVLLTAADAENHLPEFFDLGARHVIRSLRPTDGGTFDLSPIVRLLSERDTLLGSL